MRSTTSSTSQIGRVDAHGVLGGLHALAVAGVARAEVGRERVGADVGPLGLSPRRPDLGIRLEVDLHRRRRARRRCRCRGPRSRRRPSWPSSRWRSRITSRTSWWRATTGTIRSIRDWRIADVTSASSMNTRPSSSKTTGWRRASSPSGSTLAERQRLAHREPGQRAVHRARCRGSGSRAAPRACGRQCSCRRRPARRWRRSSLRDLIQEVVETGEGYCDALGVHDLDPFAAREPCNSTRASRSGDRRAPRRGRRADGRGRR